MLMQEPGSELGFLFLALGVLGIILMVLWTFLPFAVFGVKGILGNILAEQKRTTSAVNALKQDVREIAREAFQEPPPQREIPPR